jgi:hypothetical protein
LNERQIPNPEVAAFSDLLSHVKATRVSGSSAHFRAAVVRLTVDRQDPSGSFMSPDCHEKPTSGYVHNWTCGLNHDFETLP